MDMWNLFKVIVCVFIDLNCQYIAVHACSNLGCDLNNKSHLLYY
ncbi:Uncharacterised protein [Serratia liquefaciens]|nr:Uncharacterised protein [Serratia liquefaciens]